MFVFGAHLVEETLVNNREGQSNEHARLQVIVITNALPTYEDAHCMLVVRVLLAGRSSC